MRANAGRRVGLLVPSSNSVMEVDFYRRIPAGITIHTARMFMEETTPEAESEMLDEYTFPAARALATVRPHVIVFGCTSAGALRGNAADARLCEELSEETGIPVVSTIVSVRRAIGRRGSRRAGVITPYVDELNEKIKESLEADGVEVVGIEGLGITENFAIAQVRPEDIVDFAERSFADADIDLLFASCTNFRALDAVDAIQNRLGVPALTSNLAVLEGVLAAVGIDESAAQRTSARAVAAGAESPA
jgi:maleate isomerase